MASPAQRDKAAIVQNFLGSFEGVLHFRVGVFRRAQDWMKNFEPLTAADVVAMVPTLMAWNADHNAEIFFTPIGDHAFVLIDDIDAGGVALLRTRGAWPVAVVETSPGLYHVWLRLSRSGVLPLVRRWIAKMLAREYGPYGADKGSASIDHYGRLPDFCNYKTERVDKATGRSPWVKLIQSTSGRPAPVGAEWVIAAVSALSAEAERVAATEADLAARRETRATPPVGTAVLRKGSAVPAADAYQRMVDAMEPMTDFLRQDGSGPDGSRIDWHACMALLKSGYSREEVEEAVVERSLRVGNRDEAFHRTYARNTVWKAWNAEIVRQTLGGSSRLFDKDVHPLDLRHESA